MSRSHKKHFYCKDRNPYAKRLANRCVRHALNADSDLELQYGSYRKFYESWDICDWGFYDSWESYWESSIRTYERLKSWFPNREIEFPDRDEEYRKWRKYYYNK